MCASMLLGRSPASAAVPSVQRGNGQREHDHSMVSTAHSSQSVPCWQQLQRTEQRAAALCHSWHSQVSLAQLAAPRHTGPHSIRWWRTCGCTGLSSLGACGVTACTLLGLRWVGIRTNSRLTLLGDESCLTVLAGRGVPAHRRQQGRVFADQDAGCLLPFPINP